MSDTTDMIDCTTAATRDELTEIVQEMLDGLGLCAAPPHAGSVGLDRDGTTVEASVQMVGGGVDARLVLRAPMSTAIALTAALTEEAPDDISTDDACGTVAEVCNMVGGAVKTLMTDETALCVPTTSAVPETELEPLDLVPVDHLLGQFAIHVGNGSP